MLNSFWGKFGENLNKPTTLAIETPVASNPLEHIHTVRVERRMEIVYSDISENQLDNGKTNIFVAAFTTCHARLKLY